MADPTPEHRTAAWGVFAQIERSPLQAPEIIAQALTAERDKALEEAARIVDRRSRNELDACSYAASDIRALRAGAKEKADG